MSEEKKQICPTCKNPTKKGGHLCVPQTAVDEHCDWCGAMIPDSRHFCTDKLKEISYICNTCGRTAVKEEELCKPEKIR